MLQCSLKNGITTDTVGSAEIYFHTRDSLLKKTDIFLAKKRTFKPEKELDGNFPKYRTFESRKEKIPQKGSVTIFYGLEKRDPLMGSS